MKPLIETPPARWLLVSICVGLLACVLPIVSDSPAQEPKSADVVGMWRLSDASLRLMENQGGYLIVTHSLELRADQTFVLEGMPDWWRDGFGKSSGHLDSGEGTWRIRKYSDRGSELELEFETFNKVPGGNLGMTLQFVNFSPPYKLCLWVGDPDAGIKMEFERVAEAP